MTSSSKIDKLLKGSPGHQPRLLQSFKKFNLFSVFILHGQDLIRKYFSFLKGALSRTRLIFPENKIFFFLLEFRFDSIKKNQLIRHLDAILGGNRMIMDYR